MNDHLIGGQRGTPLHAAASVANEPENTFENSDMQQDAAVENDMQQHAASRLEDYTISVQEVREYLKAKGLPKSKDTIQRWCREGDLDCQKIGVLKRYFTTEASLLKLEQSILPDMMAQNAGANAVARSGMQVHEASEDGGVQVHADEDAADNDDALLKEPEDAGEHSFMQQHVQVHEAAFSGTAEVAELRAQVEGLSSQLEQAREMNDFLRDEIVSARGQRGDVVKIAEQMLGTLESIAVGGRLDKPQTSAPEPVRYQQANDVGHEV